MTHIGELLAAGPTVSFEFFPPKTTEGREQLDRCLDDLSVLDPSFVSVTYGAGGTTRGTTRDIVLEIAAQRSYPAMPHLTCIGHARADLVELIDDYRLGGVHNILALAGDPPSDGSEPGGDFTYASELVDLIRSSTNMSIGVAAFPEGHPRSASLRADRQFLAAKLDAADFGITQFFFRADDYFRMVDDVSALGCTTPVLPGIMPMLNPSTVRRFAAMNGAYFPEDLATTIDEANPDDKFAIAVDAARELTVQLESRGVPGVHVYCLNRPESALAILSR